MMRFRYIITVLFAVMTLLSCSGTVDSSSLPILTVSDTEIDMATESQAVFTVTYNGVDVTADSEVFGADGTRLESGVFTPEAEGSKTFYAVYASKQSNTVSVNVVNTSVKVNSKYDRHVCVVEFTGAWCVNCPEGYDKMMGILSKPALKKYIENIHICAFHSDLEGIDTLAVAQTQDLFKLFDGLSYPSFATDFRDSGVLTSEGASLFQPSLMTSFNEYPAHCGVAVSSVLNENASVAEITVRLTSELTSQYRVVVLVVQNNIKGYQKTPTYSEGQDDYPHSHVVRKVVTSYKGTFTGEKITEDGRIASGDEASKSWTIPVDKRWVLENTQIYALALDENGYVNNMNVCAIDGGDSGYDLK